MSGWKLAYIKDPTPEGEVMVFMHHDDLNDNPLANVPCMSLSRDEAVKVATDILGLLRPEKTGPAPDEFFDAYDGKPVRYVREDGAA